MSDVHGIRRFTDDQGTEWEVWEAHPRLVDRRRLRERRVQRRDTPDRRSAPGSRGTASSWAGLMPDGAGWLVFRSAREERRRTSIPEGWDDMSSDQLVSLLRRSRATGPVPRHRASARGELGL